MRQAEANRAAWPDGLPRPSSAPHEPDDVRVDLTGAWPTLVVRHQGQWIAVNGRHDPRRDAERVLDGYALSREDTLFVVGFGLGYLVDALEKRGWDGKIVALEPDVAFATACLERRDWVRWLSSGRLSIVWAPSFEGLDRLVPSLDPRTGDPIVIVNPVVARAYSAHTEVALRHAKRVWFDARANREAARRNAGRYLLNTLRNLPALRQAKSVSQLDGLARGVPTVVAAAGPSLDRDLPHIAAHRERALVIAVDTALRPLLNANVTPDLVVAVDPTETNARHLVELPLCPDTYLVGEGSLDPEAFSTFQDRVFAFRVADHHPWPWLHECGLDVGRLRAWGSVLTTAFDLALRMGCDPIVFAGADLAFTGGRPYARGTTYEADWRRDVAWGVRLEECWEKHLADWPVTIEPGVDGSTVPTAPHLRSFRDWLVAEAANAHGRTVANATSGGILMGSSILRTSIAECLRRTDIDTEALAARARARIARAALGNEHDSLKRTSMDPMYADVSPDTMAAWCTFGNVSVTSVGRALGASRRHDDGRVGADRPRRGASTRPTSIHPLTKAVTTSEGPGRWATVTDADAAHIVDLERSHHVQVLRLRHPGQRLLGELAERVATLGRDEAIAVVDELDTWVGAQVRRAIDPLLCERPDVWVDYRRFVDQRSRLTILRVDGDRIATRPDQVDAIKWEPNHQWVADSLVPFLMSLYNPSSVIDVGCGAGYWLQAFSRQGLGHLVGVTPRPGGGAVHPGVLTSPLETLSSSTVGQNEDERPRFDVCLLLDVAHELRPDSHASVVRTCTRLSETVIFSCRLPGLATASPYARPLAYWSDLFWQEGYVLDDRVRLEVEQHFGFPRTVYDSLVAFKRCEGLEKGCEPPDLRLHNHHMASRVFDLYQQTVWWAKRALSLQEQVSTPTPVSALVPWVVSAARMEGEPGDIRTVRTRTDAARWYLTDPRAEVLMFDDEQIMTRCADRQALTAAPGPAFALSLDEVVFKSSDGTDPRFNAHRYALHVPGFVAWAERQPVTTYVDQGL